MIVNKDFKSGYSQVNGLKMYYEIYGQGKPLVLIHGGGSTIQTSFGTIIPFLARHRQLIGMELQAHGHTGDRNMELSFEQDADDVAALLHNLGISKADFLGFSNGGQTGIELALRHAELVNKLILASAIYKRTAAPPKFWDGFNGATIDVMPQVLQNGYLTANNDPAGLQNMFNRDVQRMKTFRGWRDKQMQSIKVPVLVINGNNDVGSCEHAVELFRLIPDCELAIFPGGHGDYLGAIETLQDKEWSKFNAALLVETFLDK
jgi:pimeloyl-ACP methyl ester carboxylesterase